MRKITLIFSIQMLCVFLFQVTASAQSFTNYTTADGLMEHFIYGISQNSDGEMYASSWSSELGANFRGLAKFNGTNWTQIQIGETNAENSVHALLSDGAGNMWIGTDSGFKIYDGETFIAVNNYPTLTNSINTIFKDNANNIWVGGVGVVKYDGTTWTEVDYFVDRWATSITQDANGNMWFAQRGVGVIKFDGTDYTLYNLDNGLSSLDVYEVHRGAGNDIWAGNFTNVGIDRFDGSTWSTYTVADGISDVRVRAITKDHEGNMYFGHQLGYTKFDGTTFTNYTAAVNGFASGPVRSLFIDNSTHLWIGTFTGVSKMNEVLGTSNFGVSKNINFYPNPVQNDLQISSNYAIKSVEINDLQGKNLMTKTFQDQSDISLDFSEFASGIYFIRVLDSGNNEKVEKVVKR